MKEVLTEQDRLFLIETLQKGEPIPPDFKYKLFPTSHKEYELNYAGKYERFRTKVGDYFSHNS